MQPNAVPGGAAVIRRRSTNRNDDQPLAASPRLAQGKNAMRNVLLTASLLALAAAPAIAQAPPGPVPTSAIPQQTEPGRYWVFFAWSSAELPPDGHKVVEEAAQSFLRTGSARVSLVGSADRTGSPAYN